MKKRVALVLFTACTLAIGLGVFAEEVAPQAPALEVDCETGLPVPDDDAPMSVDVPETTEIDLGPEVEWKQDCWIENRWVGDGCCTKSWGLAYKQRLQERLCCTGTGCQAWQNTSTTQCTSFPC